MTLDKIQITTYHTTAQYRWQKEQRSKQRRIVARQIAKQAASFQSVHNRVKQTC